VRVALTLAVAIASVACSNAPERRPLQAPQRPTPEQTAAFSDAFGRTMAGCETMVADELFDLERMRMRIAPLAPLTTKTDVGAFVSKVLCTEGLAASGGRYVRTADRIVDGDTRPAFRIDSPHHSLNYHELELGLGVDGKPRVVDVYIYDRGDTVIGVLLATLEAGESGMAQLSAVLNQGPPDQLPQRLAALPPRLRASSLARLLPMMAAGMRGDRDEVRRVGAEIRATHPDDTSADIATLSLANHLRDHQLLLEATDRLRRRIGDDAWLLTMRSMALGGLGDFDEGLRIAEQAAASAPHLIETAKHLIWSQLGRHDYAAAVRGLERARQNQPGFDEAWYSVIATWPDFAASPEYAAWKAAAR
jgi:hypothetical protein